MNLNATLIGQTISFILFVWICMKYIWPPIIYIINKRQKKIIDSFELIKKEKLEIDIQKKNIQQEIKNAKKEAFSILNKAKKRKEQLLKSTIEQAEKERITILKEAKLSIQAERKKMIIESNQYTTKIAIQIAETILEKAIKKHGNSNLIKTLISDI
ncbi:ATP synthase subunit b [Buchnera aphidicola (Thelaxes suberi)]|uniref:F0F1 ATP synthase subunit B n=1 Tax=Buchnera aphidicola TaxID=9 RepID=UPI00346434CC